MTSGRAPAQRPSAHSPEPGSPRAPSGLAAPRFERDRAGGSAGAPGSEVNARDGAALPVAPAARFDFARIPVAPPVPQAPAISCPDDPCEREADEVADRVMRAAGPDPIGAAAAGVQRACAACDEDGDKTMVRRAPASSDAALDVRTAARVAQRGGSPLPPAALDFFGPRFGRDFSQVRVHTDGEAAGAARAVHARAYTLGRDIVFGAGEYAPATSRGRRLLAHELAHVVQQHGGASRGATDGPRLHRQVAPDYVVDEPGVGKGPVGAPVRIFFARNSAAIPASQAEKINDFKSGPDRAVALTLLGLATEDELAVMPTLPADRANAVATALGTPRALPIPFNTAHAGTRTVTAGTLANTQGRPNLRFQRAVELLRPGQPTMSPSTPIAPPSSCSPAIDTAFQGAKTMAFDWIDTTKPELQARPIVGPIAAQLDRFFGNHDASTARRVVHNLDLLRAEIDVLAQPANHDCADPNLPGCVSAIAFNGGHHMTICAGYASRTTEDLTRNLVHEAGHSTAGLRVTGLRNAAQTSDFSYRYERLIDVLGAVNPDQALSNSDSYAMFLMTLRASGAITPDLLPTADPAPTGFATTAQADRTQRAVALAQVWLRLASQGVTDLHGELRGVGVGAAIPASLGDPRRLDPILAQVKTRFPPILSTPTIRSDDLLMIAGVIDRYGELLRLTGQPIATSPGATTAISAVAPVGPATTGSLTLAVDAGFLTASERVRARTIVDKLIELIPTSRISVAMRPSYGRFAEFVRDKHQ